VIQVDLVTSLLNAINFEWPFLADLLGKLSSMNEPEPELEEVWKLQNLLPSLPPDSRFGQFVRRFAPDLRSAPPQLARGERLASAL